MAAPPAIRWAQGPADLGGALALREQVFVREQGVPLEEELDGRDGQALHLVALDPGAAERVIGTLRLLFDGELVKIGRVAVEPGWRRCGIATLMLDEALAEARRRGSVRARLSSQLTAVAVYERAGFVVESDVFEEAGIPHVWMGRLLDGSA
jgi:predicted GNAT family N-acyltransferase